ncbi:MAG TPA: hypothetical protein VHP36_05220 [Chitinispirillaceae bacterium]|nr:hypothetical protein [Chitinispirillaceae bacterium]
MSININRFLLITLKIILQVIFSSAILNTFYCSINNPFNDQTNAKAVFYSSLHDGDTLQIFETRSLTVKFQVRNLLEKCSLYVEENRFFEKVCIDFNKIDSFKCNISFYDTGMHQIKLVFQRDNGEIIDQKMLIYAVNPLVQPAILANVGDSIHLNAKGVLDGEVNYIWRFSDGEVLLNHSSSATFKIRGTSGPEAYFSVSDRKGIYFSPTVKFNCIVNDKTGPVITCNNDTKKDTLTAYDSIYYFSVKVEDDGGFVSATTNNEPPCTTLEYNSYRVFVWSIKGVNALKSPMLLVVSASDAAKNLSNKKYWLVYDSSGISSDKVYLKVTYPTSFTLKRRQFYLSGEVVNFLNSQSKILSLSVDNVLYDTWDFKDNISGKWNFNVSMKGDKNNCSIKLSLKNKHGDVLVDSGFQVIFDPSSPDTKKPNMVELSVDGLPLTEWDEYIIVGKSPVPLRIIAFDEGDGISSVTVDNDTIHKSDSVSFIWEKALIPSFEGDSFKVKITDSAGYDTSMLFNLRLNYRPEIKYYPQSIKVEVGKKYSGVINAVDKDGDKIFYSVIKGPPSFLIDSTSGNFSWVPEITDTVITSILINYKDHYWNEMICTLDVVVLNSQRVYQSLKFDNSQIDFPSELIADSQKLDILLKTIPVLDNKQIRYDVHLFPQSSVIQIVDGRLQWTPAANDTGIHRIIITATDILNDSNATLHTQIRVLANKKPLSILLSYSGKKTNETTYNLSDPSLSANLMIFISDPDSVLEGNQTVLIKHCSIAQYKNLNMNRTVVFLDAMEKQTGYDTLCVSISDQNRTYLEKRVLYYGTAPTIPVITNPSDGQIVNTDEFRFSWSGSADPDTFNKVSYSLYLAPGSNEFVAAVSGLADTQYIVSLGEAANYRCKVVTFDGKNSVESGIIHIDVDPLNRVRFNNSLSDFPSFIETGDTFSLLLRPRSGTGKPPFTYNVSSSGLYTPIIIPDIINKDCATLQWIPSDTGIFRLTISITDSLNNIDILEPLVHVVPVNSPATIIPSYSDSILDMGKVTGPQTLIFKIEDKDDPLIEQYSIIIKLGQSERLLSVGQTRQFTVVINTNSSVKDEILEIKILDQDLWKTGYKLHIKYSD